MVDKFLRVLFLYGSAGEVALDINIEEGRISAYRHCRAVLVLDGGKIAEVKRLYRLLCRFGGSGNIAAVNFGKFFKRFKRFNLLGKLFPVAYFIRRHIAVFQKLVLFFLLYQKINAVKRNPAIVAYNSAPAVSVGQTGKDMSAAGGTHFRRVRVVNAVVMRFTVFREYALYFGIDFVSVHFKRFRGHSYSAEGL